jgi:hypothetical protein
VVLRSLRMSLGEVLKLLQVLQLRTVSSFLVKQTILGFFNSKLVELHQRTVTVLRFSLVPT